MYISAQLQGKETDDKKAFTWNLIFTPVTKPGILAPSNRWTVKINRATGEIVFDRNGLYIRRNINTIATDILPECEKTVISMFFDLLRIYPENEYVTVDMYFEVDDDNICHYLLTPVLTANL